jgi:hypothetical protein
VTGFTIKHYSGRIPACGVFCGGCPAYLKEKKPCPGAEINSARCESCTKFHLCCKEKNITHCYECSEFLYKKLKAFAKNWLKYGQDFIENQHRLKNVGEERFRETWNEKAR